MKKIIAVLTLAIVFAGSKPLLAQEFGDSAMDRGRVFAFQGGEALFRGGCQGCHMADGKGATGAGEYPSLAKNSKLQIAGYPISVVLHGQKAMPGFGAMMSDRQVADVINYLRSHLGNQYRDQVTPADVKAAR